MARKIDTGFELPFGNSESNVVKAVDFNSFNNYLFKGFLAGVRNDNPATQYPSFSGALGTSGSFNIFNNTSARTKTDGIRGGYLRAGHGFFYQPFFDVSKFNNGFFHNAWIQGQYLTPSISQYLRLFCLYDGTNSYQVYLASNGGTGYELRISNNTTTTELVTPVTINGLTKTDWFNVKAGIDNAGNITASLNGSNISYASSITFSNLTRIGICGTQNWPVAMLMDDLAINDGSGSVDNSTPPSIRAYNFFDSATLNANVGFSKVGGSDVLSNLQDGDDDTRVSASADSSYLDFSLPDLAATGMAETVSNFVKIRAINIYGRQIEATKSGSMLCARITDTVAAVNREECLNLPLTVGNGSVAMLDDDVSDWVLANLDSGDLDFRVTFDKP